MMYRAKYARSPAAGRGCGRIGALLTSFSLCFAVMAGGTLGYLCRSVSVVNRFTAGAVKNVITEVFDGEVKKNVSVRNTGNVPVYIRVRLVTWRAGDDGSPTGGAAEIPDFTPGTGWILYDDGCYYHTRPVAPGASPEHPLIGSDGIALQTYSDAYGGHQVLEVLAESVQASPPCAAGEAWGVSIRDDAVAPYVAGGAP